MKATVETQKLPEERRTWIVKYIRVHGPVDILRSDFVDDYIAATKASFRLTCFGAFKCSTLGRDLAHLVSEGALRRRRLGLSSNWQPGFPKWVWVYSEAPSVVNGTEEHLAPPGKQKVERAVKQK